MFSISGQKGFHVTFKNGCTVSVQFGRGNYCDNYNSTAEYNGPVEPCRNAEVAAFDANGEWIMFGEYGEVMPRQTPEEVLAIMNKVASRA